jgi:hypothetical protein
MLYEIGVYNKRVRDTIRGGEDWNNAMGILDSFEEVKYFEFQATSMDEAEKIAERDYPKRFGYVLDYIRTVK